MGANRRLSSLVRPLAIATAALVTVWPTAVSAQSEYPPGSFTLTLSASTVAPDTPVTLTAHGCVVGEVVRLSIDDTSIAHEVTCTAAAGPAGFRQVSPRPEQAAGGTASETVNAPSTTGTYTARATETGGLNRTATAVLNVVSATTPPAPGGSLPSTGSDVGRIVASAATVFAIGLGSVIVSRRRRVPLAH